MVDRLSWINVALGSWLTVTAALFANQPGAQTRALPVMLGGTIALLALWQTRTRGGTAFRRIGVSIAAVASLAAVDPVLFADDAAGPAIGNELLVAIGVLALVAWQARTAVDGGGQAGADANRLSSAGPGAEISKGLSLSVLDIVPVAAGSDSAAALRNTIDLARLAEQLGFERYWIAERHGLEASTGSAPEIIVSHVASETARIRVGVGGIFLPNHKVTNIVEAFRVLDELHPGRVDLGIDLSDVAKDIERLGPGKSQVQTDRVAGGVELKRLLALFTSRVPFDDPQQSAVLVPRSGEPPIWLIGFDVEVGRLAGQCGVGFVYAHYLNPAGVGAALQAYRSEFRPSSSFAAPHALIASIVICAESDSRATELASSMDYGWLQIEEGRDVLWPSVEMATRFPYTAAERPQLETIRQRMLVGGPSTLAKRLGDLATQHGVDEMLILTITHDHAARRESYQLLAEACRRRSEDQG
jgi:luciferase family oxidoreductase group 1